MGRGMLRVLLVSLVAACARTSPTLAQTSRPPANQPNRPPAGPASRPAGQAARPQVNYNDPKMKQLLRDWEQRSAQLKTLDVRIRRVDKSAAWDENEQYEGRAFLQSPNRACLDFKKVVTGPKGEKTSEDYERIICTGTDVWQYVSRTKQIFIFPLDKENQKRALEEGPLPFLFSMRAADAEARYLMAIVKEDKDYAVISVVPRLKIDQESFSKAFLRLSRETFLPDRIFLVSPDGKSTKDFTLYQINRNVKVPETNFKGIPLGKPWQIVRDPVGDNTRSPRLGNQRPAGATPSPQPRR